MKKNFFKKLSFVLALAMIISVIAPAAGAFAAESLSLNSTKKYLHLSGQPGSNEYNFNINGTKQKGWKYQWTSSNDAVATVNAANGVTTAEGIGSAKVTVVIKDSKGAEVNKLTADVVVKDNIETVKISNAPAADKVLKVNEVYDFNRTFTTLSGSTTKTTSVTRWAVDKADKATIDVSGKFKASEAGTYKVTALAFQSTDKYDEWVKTNNASLVLDTDEATVTVAAGIVETKQVDSDTFTVTFDSDMSKTDIATAGLLYQIVAGKPVATGTEKIKKIALDGTGKIATVDTFVSLKADTTYNFVYGKLTGTFKTAVKKLANIAGITFGDFDVDVTANPKDMRSSVSLYDNNGVVIYTGADTDVAPYLTFSYGGDLAKGNVSGNNVYIYAEGTQAKVSAKFSGVIYDDAAKTYKTLNFTDDAVATGKKADTNITTSSLQYSAPLVTDGTANADLSYNAAGVTVAAKDSNKIVVKYTKNNDTNTTLYDATGSVFNFKSTDADKLVISGNYMYPIATGNVTVLVYSGTTAVGAFDVSIVAARAFGSAVVENGKELLTVGNSLVDQTGASATVIIKDTLGKDVQASSAVVAVNAVPSGANQPTVTTDVTTAGKVVVTAKGYTGSTPAAVNAFSYKVTITALGATKDVYFTVNVVDATSANASVAAYYQLELGKTSLDIKGVTSSAVSVDVYGYNAAGVKVSKLASTDYTVTVKDGGNNNPTLAFTTTSIPVVVSASGSAVTADAVGTYVVTVKKATGANVKINNVAVADDAYLAAGTLTVSDTTAKAVNIDSYAVADLNVLAAVKSAFTFKLNGGDITESNIVKVDYTKGASGIVSVTDASAVVAAGDNVFVAAVYYKVDNADGSYFLYKFDVNRSITIK